MDQIDLLLYNGNIRTITHGQASAIAICGQRICAVGETETLLAAATASTRRIDLGGRTVIPGFNDAHAHIWKMGHLLTSMLDLRSLTSFAALHCALQERNAQLPEGAWLLGRGLNETQLDERRLPTRGDLDGAVPHRPIVLTRTCGHIYAANSMALELAGINAETGAPAGGVIDRDRAGRPTGLLYETAMDLILRVQPPPSKAEYRAMITAATRHQLSLGITSTSDCGVGPELLAVYRGMDAEGVLPSRVNVMPLGRADDGPLPEKYISERLRVDTVKFLADGGLSGATAALSVSYRHQQSRGVLRIEQDELLELCREPHERGWRIATHAIGDVTIDCVLSAYEALGQGSYRHRIEHFGLPSGEQLSRAVRLGVLAVPQTIFLHELGANFRAFVPDALWGQIYPVRAMLDAGLIVALSSDAPVVADDCPLSGMEAAITRNDARGEPILKEQGISAEEALYAYTMAGAICCGSEHLQGSLSAGKRADLTVLSADPLSVPAEELRNVRVEMTLLDGTIVYER
jgi:predicted amidohydrolase YtcJ